MVFVAAREPPLAAWGQKTQVVPTKRFRAAAPREDKLISDDHREILNNGKMGGTYALNPRTGKETRYQVQKLNHRHEQIINWLISNPHKNLTACAMAFNYTQPWLSQVVNSDAFQARYRQRCEEVGAICVHTIHNKLTGLTALTLDKMSERVTNGTASEKSMCETLNMTLKALGYGPEANKSPAEGEGGAKHLHLHVDAGALVHARELAASTFSGTTEKKLDNHSKRDDEGVVDGEYTALPAA